MLRGMILTRAVDNRLKAFFTGSEVRYGNTPFQGKGFRSLGQEAIYAAPLRFKRGAAFRAADGTWQGDVVAPIIRDLGAAIAMRHDRETVRDDPERADGQGRAADERPRSARRRLCERHPAGGGAAGDQQPDGGRHGPGVQARRRRASGAGIHRRGRLVARGMARGNQFVRRAQAAGGVLPGEQPDRALDAGAGQFGRARVRREGAGYGIPGITIDGTDPEAIAAAFTWAAERARAGEGPRSSRWSPCACAVTRITTTCCISARIRSLHGTMRR